MYDRHQAEITVMQFTGHSLPVHQSMSVPWDFTLSHIVNQARLRDFFSQLPSECVTSFRYITWEWHVWPGGRSIYNSMKVTVIPLVIMSPVQSLKIGIETGILENKRTSGNHQEDSIVEIGQNTKKSPGDLRRFVTQTPVENRQLTMV